MRIFRVELQANYPNQFDFEGEKWKSLLSAAFVYSRYALYAMTDALTRGDSETAMSYMHGFYFESAAMILALITVGKMLEAKSKGRTTDTLRGLMKLAPETATVIRDGKKLNESAKIQQFRR